jgi:hypothetical protein
MDDLDVSLWRTATHEAGHACAAFLLGATVGAGPVTIVPTGGYHGICFSGHPRRYPDGDLAGLHLPYPLLPARLRRYYESEVMVYFAGAIAADLHAGRGCPVPEAPDVSSQHIVPLPPRELVKLEQAAASDRHESDTGKAFRILLALHFDDEDLAHRHGSFLAGETEALVSGDVAKRMVLALAAELMKFGTLPARRWKAVLSSIGAHAC